MGRGAWSAAVHGVAKSRTWLSDFIFTFHFHALEKEITTHSSVLAWRIPGMGEPGGLPSMGSHRVRHDWSDLAAAAICYINYLVLFGLLSFSYCQRMRVDIMLLGCDYLGPEMCTWLMVWEVRWLELKMFPKFPRTISCFWPVIYESGTENEREWGDYETKSYRFLEAFVPSSHFQGWWTPLFSNPIQWLYFIFDWMKTCGKIRITSIIHNINNTLYYRELS